MEQRRRRNSIAGAPVDVDWTVLVAAGVVCSGLGLALPRHGPGLPDVAYWATAAASSAVFTGYLLFHGLAQAFAARRRELTVEELRLWPFGAVVRVEGRSAGASASGPTPRPGPAVGDGLRVMTGEPVVGPGLTVEALLEQYRHKRSTSFLPVMRFSGVIDGIVSWVRLREISEARRATTRVSDIAYPLSGIVPTTPHEEVPDLLGRLSPSSQYPVLVLDDARPVGTVTSSDLGR